MKLNKCIPLMIVIVYFFCLTTLFGQDVTSFAKNSVNPATGDVEFSLNMLPLGYPLSFNINYDSEVVKYRNTGIKDLPTGSLGVGWNYAIPAITCETINNVNVVKSNKYTLSLPDKSYNLLLMNEPTNNSEYYTFVTEEKSDLMIEFHKNTTYEYWIIKDTKRDRIFQFGDLFQSEDPEDNQYCVITASTVKENGIWQVQPIVTQWNLKDVHSISNTDNFEMHYFYENEESNYYYDPTHPYNFVKYTSYYQLSRIEACDKIYSPDRFVLSFIYLNKDISEYKTPSNTENFQRNHKYLSELRLLNQSTNEVLKKIKFNYPTNLNTLPYVPRRLLESISTYNQKEKVFNTTHTFSYEVGDSDVNGLALKTIQFEAGARVEYEYSKNLVTWKTKRILPSQQIVGGDQCDYEFGGSVIPEPVDWLGNWFSTYEYWHNTNQYLEPSIPELNGLIYGGVHADGGWVFNPLNSTSSIVCLTNSQVYDRYPYDMITPDFDDYYGWYGRWMNKIEMDSLGLQLRIPGPTSEDICIARQGSEDINDLNDYLLGVRDSYSIFGSSGNYTGLQYILDKQPNVATILSRPYFTEGWYLGSASSDRYWLDLLWNNPSDIDQSGAIMPFYKDYFVLKNKGTASICKVGHDDIEMSGTIPVHVDYPVTKLKIYNDSEDDFKAFTYLYSDNNGDQVECVDSSSTKTNYGVVRVYEGEPSPGNNLGYEKLFYYTAQNALANNTCYKYSCESFSNQMNITAGHPECKRKLFGLQMKHQLFDAEDNLISENKNFFSSQWSGGTNGLNGQISYYSTNLYKAISFSENKSFTNEYVYDSKNRLLNTITYNSIDLIRKSTAVTYFTEYSLPTTTISKTIVMNSDGSVNSEKIEDFQVFMFDTTKYLKPMTKTYKWVGIGLPTSEINEAFYVGFLAQPPAYSDPNWILSSENLVFDANGRSTVSANALGIKSSQKLNSKNQIIFQATNASDKDCQYYSFEEYSDLPQLTSNFLINNLDYHTGNKSLKSTGSETLSLDINLLELAYINDPTRKKYLFSAWIKNDYCTSSSVNIYFQYSQSAGQQFVKIHKTETSLNSAQYGKWVKIESIIDLSSLASMSGRLKATIQFSGSTNIYIDDIVFCPLDVSYLYSTFDPLTYEKTSVTDSYGVTNYNEFFSYKRLAVSYTDEFKGLSTSLRYNAFKANGEVEPTAVAYEPNHELSITAPTGLYLSRNNHEMGDLFNYTTSCWIMNAGIISEKSTSTSNSGYFESKTALDKNFAVRVSVSNTTPVPLYYRFKLGTLEITRNNGHLLINNQTTNSNQQIFSTVKETRVYGNEDFLIIGYDKFITLILDGKIIFSKTINQFDLQNGLYRFEKRSSANTGLSFSNLTVFNQPQVGVSYFDCLYNPLQNEQTALNGLMAVESLYDNYDRSYLTTKPVLYSYSSEQTAFGFKANLITTMPTVSNNGKLIGDISTFYAALHNIADDDKYYQYSSVEYKNNSLGEIIKAGSSGKNLSILGSANASVYQKKYLSDGRTENLSTSPDGVVSSAIYDCWGRQIESVSDTEGLNVKTQNVFNNFGQLIETRLPNYFQPPAGTQANNWKIQFSYNYLNQLISKTTPDEGTIVYTYDKFGRLTNEKDNAGNVHNYSKYRKYDKYGRVFEEGLTTLSNNIDIKRKEYLFDDFGYNPDLRGRLAASINYAETFTSIGQIENNTEHYTYNKYGQITSRSIKNTQLSEQTYKFSYNYNTAGQLCEILYPGLKLNNYSTPQIIDPNIRGDAVIIGSNLKNQSGTTIQSDQSVVFKADNSITLQPSFVAKEGSYFVAQIDPEVITPAKKVCYSYDRFGNMTGVGNETDPNLYAAYGYNTLGQLAEKSQNNGGQTVYSYNRDNQLASINHSKFNENLSYNTYTGMITGTNMTVTDINNANQTFIENYTYDNIGRLLGVQSDKSNHQVGNILYDANGNIRSIVENGNTVKQMTYYQGTNKLKSKTQDASNINYNENGALISKATTGQHQILNIQYDRFTNMALNICETPSKTEFEYNASNKRIVKRFINNVNDEVTSEKIYLWGADSCPLIETTKDGQITYNILGRGQEIIAVLNGDNTYFPLTDHLGSTRVVLNQNGAVVGSFDYNVWGKLLSGVVTEQMNYLYTGQELDTETGLFNYKARMYDPDLNRFLSTDPLGQYVNPYSYCGSNPVNFTDPSGMASTYTPIVEENKRKAVDRARVDQMCRDFANPPLDYRQIYAPMFVYTDDDIIAYAMWGWVREYTWTLAEREAARKAEEQKKKMKEVAQSLGVSPDELESYLRNANTCIAWEKKCAISNMLAIAEAYIAQLEENEENGFVLDDNGNPIQLCMNGNEWIGLLQNQLSLNVTTGVTMAVLLINPSMVNRVSVSGMYCGAGIELSTSGYKVDFDSFTAISLSTSLTLKQGINCDDNFGLRIGSKRMGMGLTLYPSKDGTLYEKYLKNCDIEIGAGVGLSLPWFGFVGRSSIYQYGN